MRRRALQRRLLVLLLVCAFFVSPAAVFSQSANPAEPQPFTLAQYIQELDRCSAALNRTPLDPKAVHELRASLPASWTVATDRGRYTIDMAWLSSGLASAEEPGGATNEAVRQARERLATYREDAKSLEQGLQRQRDLAQSRAKLNAILGTREFQGQQGPTWLDIERQKLRDWIYRQLEKIFGRARVKSIGNLVAWTLVAVACGLLLFWTLRFLLRAGQRTDMDLSGAAPVGHDWRRWLRQARDAAKRGEYRAAIHAAYWAAIVRMEETQSLPEDRSRTPRESLRLIGRGSPAYAPLSQLTRRFELVWYGYRDATAADWDDASQQLEMLGCPRS